ncbi:NIFU2 [Scenedesmus sp. PABB004]|nr:NIFU2 [Scenedesmus sp. PABB004]
MASLTASALRGAVPAGAWRTSASTGQPGRRGPAGGARGRAQRVAASSAATDLLELTEENVEKVLDEVRPYLMADGGNVEFVEIDGLVVKLKLAGACGSCPSSLTTMTMGIKRRLMEKIPEILEVEQVMEESSGMELTAENVDQVLGEIRPYLVGTGGGELLLDSLDGPIVKVKITGPAANVMTVRVAVTQKLREKIPSIAAVQLLSPARAVPACGAGRDARRGQPAPAAFGHSGSRGSLRVLAEVQPGGERGGQQRRPLPVLHRKQLRGGPAAAGGAAGGGWLDAFVARRSLQQLGGYAVAAAAGPALTQLGGGAAGAMLAGQQPQSGSDAALHVFTGANLPPGLLAGTLDGIADTVWGRGASIVGTKGDSLSAAGASVTALGGIANGGASAAADAARLQRFGAAGEDLAGALAPGAVAAHGLALGVGGALAPMAQQAGDDAVGLAVQAANAAPDGLASLTETTDDIVRTLSPFLVNGRDGALDVGARATVAAAAAKQRFMHGTALPMASDAVAVGANIGAPLGAGWQQGFGEGFSAAMDRRAPYGDGPRPRPPRRRSPRCPRAAARTAPVRVGGPYASAAEAAAAAAAAARGAAWRGAAAPPAGAGGGWGEALLSRARWGLRR